MRFKFLGRGNGSGANAMFVAVPGRDEASGILSEPLLYSFSRRLDFFHPVIQKDARKKLEVVLQKARYSVSPEEFKAWVFNLSFFFTVVSILTVPFLLYFLAGYLGMALGIFSSAILFPVLYASLSSAPSARIKSLAKKYRIYYGSYIMQFSILLSSGLSTYEVLAAMALGGFGVLSEESTMILQLTGKAGYDIVTAVRKRASLSPDPRWENFLLGVAITLSEGTDMVEYVRSRITQHIGSEEAQNEKYSQQISMLSEIYVSSIGILPMFLLIMIGSLAPLGGVPNPVVPYIAILMLTVVLGIFMIWLIQDQIKEVENI